MITRPLMMNCQMSETPSSDEPVGQHRDDQRADQRAPDRADAADEAGAAEDDRGDGVELVALAELQAVRGVEPRRRHHAAEPGEQARERSRRTAARAQTLMPDSRAASGLPPTA